MGSSSILLFLAPKESKLDNWPKDLGRVFKWHVLHHNVSKLVSNPISSVKSQIGFWLRFNTRSWFNLLITFGNSPRLLWLRPSVVKFVNSPIIVGIVLILFLPMNMVRSSRHSPTFSGICVMLQPTKSNMEVLKL